MECHQKWLKVDEPARAQAGRPHNRAVTLWVLPEENTCLATHFSCNLARLRAGQSLSRANWSKARLVDRNQTMWVIESTPLG